MSGAAVRGGAVRALCRSDDALGRLDEGRPCPVIQYATWNLAASAPPLTLANIWTRFEICASSGNNNNLNHGNNLESQHGQQRSADSDRLACIVLRARAQAGRSGRAVLLLAADDDARPATMQRQRRQQLICTSAGGAPARPETRPATIEPRRTLARSSASPLLTQFDGRRLCARQRRPPRDAEHYLITI
jgi:hypothetical protein